MSHIYTQTLMAELDSIILFEDINPSWKTDNHLDDLVKLEARVIEAGGELTLIHPGGVWIKHIL